MRNSITSHSIKTHHYHDLLLPRITTAQLKGTHMNDNHKQFTCFIASPGDVKAERDACEAVVNEINRTFATSNISLRLIRWETDAHPDLGSDGQTIINEQLRPEEADFFIGVFWSRFGTPTPRAESGTEEEFNLAFEKWKKTKSNRILVFFKTEAVPQPIDAQQIDKVNQFKDKLTGMGLYKEFRTTEEFSSALRETLNKNLLQIVSSQIGINNINETIKSNLENRLKEALSVFQQEITWIDRYICDRARMPNSLADLENKAVLLDTVLESADSFVISAPPQFGLTSAAHHLRLVAWEKGEAWGYIDMDDLPSFLAIESVIRKDYPGHEIDGIIVDS